MNSTPHPVMPIPPDDPDRNLVLALPHVGVVGHTYTILLTGEDTAGRYTLIDMHVPSGGGPPPHRHDFEEMFTVLDGETEITFCGVTSIARAGETVNVPANAPHAFTNGSDHPRKGAVHVLASRPGKVLPGGRNPVGRPDAVTPSARRGSRGSVHRQSPGARPAIPDRATSRALRTRIQHAVGRSPDGAAPPPLRPRGKAVTTSTSPPRLRAAGVRQSESRRPRWLRVHAPTRMQVSTCALVASQDCCKYVAGAVRTTA